MLPNLGALFWKSREQFALGPDWLDGYVRLVLAEHPVSCLADAVGVFHSPGLDSSVGVKKRVLERSFDRNKRR
jgi:hypothetical protein